MCGCSEAGARPLHPAPPQPGVYILNDLMDGDSRRPHRRRPRRPADDAAAAAAAAAAADAAAAVAAAALLAAPAAEFSDEEGESSGSDTEVESDESDSEPEKGEAAAVGDNGLPPGARVRKLPALAAVAAAAAAQAEASQPPLVAFSRDAAERLWRGQHLAGGGGGPEEVTGLALDLMLLATMCSGNDYLPAIQVGVAAGGAWAGVRQLAASRADLCEVVNSWVNYCCFSVTGHP